MRKYPPFGAGSQRSPHARQAMHVGQSCVQSRYRWPFVSAAPRGRYGTAEAARRLPPPVRRGTPLTSDDLMILHAGVRAALVPGPMGHCFLPEAEAKPARLNEARQLRM